MKKIKKTEKTPPSRPQSKKGKYSARLSDAPSSGHHESFRTGDSFYRMLVESLDGYGIFTTDKEGNISSWTSGAEKLFGYSEKEIIGENASIIFNKEDIDRKKLIKELRKAVTNGRVLVERYHVHKNGSKFWASGLIFSLEDKHKVSRGFTFIVRDLTEKVEFEKRKDDFISTATHELKTPITSMKLYAHIVEQEIKRSGDKANIQSVVALNKQLNKLTSLMDYLLDVSKIQKGELKIKKTLFSMDALIKETIEMVRVISKKHKIIQGGGVVEKIYADRDRIGQVLMNLITNAIKYSPDADNVVVSSADKLNDIEVSVKDYGFGISKADQDQIFTRFYRASAAVEHKIEGIGLGLYVAKQIVVAHKGKMWLESQEKKGSTFYFSVPKAKK